jgi:hypothetical protein
MHERQPRALGHEWGNALHVVGVVMMHRLLHDHLALIRLQYLCLNYHNTHRRASQCQTKPTEVQW